MFSDTNRQLRKLSIYKPMNFRIVEIDFDFDDSLEDITKEERDDIVEEVLATTWEATDGDDLVEEITTATGWCVNSIDYCYVLS
tara:strand:- start:2184 stop:2435 length:252 start_codon:yes stop_codon:yes gene_type:complete